MRIRFTKALAATLSCAMMSGGFMPAAAYAQEAAAEVVVAEPVEVVEVEPVEVVAAEPVLGETAEVGIVEIGEEEDVDVTNIIPESEDTESQDVYYNDDIYRTNKTIVFGTQYNNELIDVRDGDPDTSLIKNRYQFTLPTSGKISLNAVRGEAPSTNYHDWGLQFALYDENNTKVLDWSGVTVNESVYLKQGTYYFLVQNYYHAAGIYGSYTYAYFNLMVSFDSA